MQATKRSGFEYRLSPETLAGTSTVTQTGVRVPGLQRPPFVSLKRASLESVSLGWSMTMGSGHVPGLYLACTRPVQGRGRARPPTSWQRTHESRGRIMPHGRRVMPHGRRIIRLIMPHGRRIMPNGRRLFPRAVDWLCRTAGWFTARPGHASASAPCLYSLLAMPLQPPSARTHRPACQYNPVQAARTPSA